MMKRWITKFLAKPGRKQQVTGYQPKDTGLPQPPPPRGGSGVNKPPQKPCKCCEK